MTGLNISFDIQKTDDNFFVVTATKADAMENATTTKAFTTQELAMAYCKTLMMEEPQ